jgi:hypothetical protein
MDVHDEALETFKRKPRRAAKPEDRGRDRPEKITLTVPAEWKRRFAVHADMTGMTKSALFVELVKAGCRRFVISDRERAEKPPEETAA